MFVILAICLHSCLSMSTLQTARVVPEGEYETVMAGGYFPSHIESNEDIFGYLFEGAVRGGIANKIDAGIKWNNIFNFTIDGKYQFLGNMETIGAMSTGLGINLSLESRETTDPSYDVFLPLYFSIHPSPWFSLYSSYKGVFRFYNGGDIKNSIWNGGSVGVRLGNKFGLLLEYSYYSSNKGFKPNSQIVGGLCMRL